MTEKKRGRPTMWPEGSEQVRTMREHYPSKGAVAVAEMLGLTPRQVTDGAKVLKVRREIQSGERQARYWYGDRLEEARAAVWSHGIAGAARILGIERSSLAHAAERYKFRISPEAKELAVSIGLAAARAARASGKVSVGRAQKKQKPAMEARPCGQRHERYMKARIQQRETPLPRVASVFELGEALNA